MLPVPDLCPGSLVPPLGSLALPPQLWGGIPPLLFPIPIRPSPLRSLGPVPPPGVPDPISLVVGGLPSLALLYLYVYSFLSVWIHCPPTGVPGPSSLFVGGSPSHNPSTPSVPHKFTALLVGGSLLLPPYLPIGRVV